MTKDFLGSEVNQSHALEALRVSIIGIDDSVRSLTDYAQRYELGGIAEALTLASQSLGLAIYEAVEKESDKPCKHCGIVPWDDDSPCPDNPQVMGHEPE